jgi:RHS repeat-associated protein
MFAATGGYRNDGDAGLMHVGARYYDAQVGRFVTRDTVLSEHPYVYCNHDPVNAVDPSGHTPYWLSEIVKFGTPTTPPQLGFGIFAGWLAIGGLAEYVTSPPSGNVRTDIIGTGGGLVGVVGGVGLIGGATAGGTLVGGAITVGGAIAVGTGVGLIAVGAIAVGVGVYRLGQDWHWW